MIKHKWKDDTCERCKMFREKREKKTHVHDRSVLIHGVWEDKPVFRYDIRWWYIDFFGKQIGFKRPDCIPPKSYDD